MVNDRRIVKGEGMREKGEEVMKKEGNRTYRIRISPHIPHE
jgi:hypothetical protein